MSLYCGAPDPASVRTSPACDMSRIRCAAASATYSLPIASAAILLGFMNCAYAASPSRTPDNPEPATVVTVYAGSVDAAAIETYHAKQSAVNTTGILFTAAVGVFR